MLRESFRKDSQNQLNSSIVRKLIEIFKVYFNDKYSWQKFGESYQKDNNLTLPSKTYKGINFIFTKFYKNGLK